MLVVLLAALAGPAFACLNASAQVPEPLQLSERLGRVTAPVRQAVEPVAPVLAPVAPVLEPVAPVLEPAADLVRQPLPDPVEEVVEASPAAPVREEVRRLVPGGSSDGGGPPDTGGGSPTAGAAGSSPSGGGSSADAGARRGGASPPAQLAPTGDTDSSPQRDVGAPARRNGGAGDGSSSRRERNRAAAPRTTAGLPRVPKRADPAPRRDAPERDTDADDPDGSLGRTVDRIVEVVPTAIWIALGGLLLLALTLGARALVDNRRARALRREREDLLRDMSLLERVLLPDVPERLGQLAVSVAYRPAEGPAAGGDFYDVFELSGGRVALLVGDVSGHGREALERTGSLRPTLHAHLEAGTSPRAALQSAAEAVGVDANGGFTTVVAAVHDPSKGSLTYAAAGHPPPVVVGPGAHEPITAACAPPIGVGLRTGVRQTTVPLPRGSAACFFTDGLLEARSGEGVLGYDWLAGVVARFGPLDSSEGLLDRVAERADETPDDMTACLVRAVAGTEAVGPRIEELELEAEEVRTATPKRFLAACGVPPAAANAALAEAERVAAGAGTALVAVAIDGSGATVSVTPPTPGALATT
jgi:serine phosphatase RsbU (regulator of sigma subunit)